MDGVTFNIFKSTFAVFGLFGIAVLAAGFAAYGIFRFLGSKWLENRFAEQLEAFKHRQNIEMENNKYHINRMFDRASKLHQNEYIQLPATWAKMVEAFDHTSAALGHFQQYGNVQGVSDDMVRARMEKQGHTEHDIARILQLTDRQKEYQTLENYRRLRVAEDRWRDFMQYLAVNQIFIRPEIAEKFHVLGKLIRFAQIERESQLDFPNQGREMFVSLNEFRSDGERLLNELEKTVRDRLADTIAEPAPVAVP